MDEPPKLSLERPYKGEFYNYSLTISPITFPKDDKGDYILNVVDITQDGNYILEPCVF